MQSEIEKIEEELKDLSPWPWEAQSDNETVIDANGNLTTANDAAFAIQSPGRIAKLVEYVKAIEAFSPLKLVESLQAASERLKIQFALVGDAEKELDRIRAARKSLGLE